MDYLSIDLFGVEKGVDSGKISIGATRVSQSCTGIPGLREPHGIPPGVRVRIEVNKIGGQYRNRYTCLPCLDVFVAHHEGAK